MIFAKLFSTLIVKYTNIKDVMKAPTTTISSLDSMEIVMKKFEMSKSAFLPVLRDGKYHGFISKSIALEAYRTKLRSMTIE